MELLGENRCYPIDELHLEMRDPLSSSTQTHFADAEKRCLKGRLNRATLAEPDQRFCGNEYSRCRRDSPGIYRWGLQFDGENGLSDFMKRLEERRLLEVPLKPKRFESAAELLPGNALVWYRAHKIRFRLYCGVRVIV